VAQVLDTVLYLHGLDSAPVASKTSGLANLGFTVIAPKIHYREEHDLYIRLRKLAVYFCPKVIIGSSLGGYTAFWLSRDLGIPAVLINPALSFYDEDPGLVPKNISLSHEPVYIYQGALDDTVKPELTRQWLRVHLPRFQPILELAHDNGHQISATRFIDLMNRALCHPEGILGK
jgi:uncharacterized protein